MFGLKKKKERRREERKKGGRNKGKIDDFMLKLNNEIKVGSLFFLIFFRPYSFHSSPLFSFLSIKSGLSY